MDCGNQGVVLFLDFKKAFDSISHTFLFCLLEQMGFPIEFVTWIRILYKDAVSCIKFKNWLTPMFDLNCGVRQGCPISYHLFNLVGQVLIYSLRQAGFFAWWTFPSNPCSMYADNGALFVPNIQQLAGIVLHIQGLTKFTGLSLNLDKTVIFNPSISKSICYRGMQMQNTLVKYLGTFGGSRDLSCLNFDLTLKKAWKIVSRWNKRNLTLPTRVLVSKTLFSLLLFMCVTVLLLQEPQVELLQKILNEFLWHGWNKIRSRPMVMYAPVSQGGLNMINIKNILSTLHVK